MKLGALMDDLRTMNWWWVVVRRDGRYRVVWLASLALEPAAASRGAGLLWQTLRAMYVGLFANEVLPFHAGEVVRCYLISRWTELPFSVSLIKRVDRAHFRRHLAVRVFPGRRCASSRLPQHMHWLVRRRILAWAPSYWAPRSCWRWRCSAATETRAALIRKARGSAICGS